MMMGQCSVSFNLEQDCTNNVPMSCHRYDEDSEPGDDDEHDDELNDDENKYDDRHHDAYLAQRHQDIQANPVDDNFHH